MIELVFLRGTDKYGETRLVPMDSVLWIGNTDQNDTPDIFCTKDHTVYTCAGGWQQAAEVYLLDGDDGWADEDVEEKRVLH